MHDNGTTFFTIFTVGMRPLVPILLLSILLASACGDQFPVPENEVPVITETFVESVGTDSALLVATVSNGDLVYRCGFHIYLKGSDLHLSCDAVCKDNSFRASVIGLRPDTGYELEAFIDNGNGLNIKSDRHPFVTLEDDFGLPSYSLDFESFLLREFDTDHDGTLSTEEALAVKEMTVYTDSIPSINRLGRFRNLNSLTCRPHRMNCKSLLRELDLSENPAISYLDAIRNDMESISFPENSEIRHLNLGFNNFITLDLTRLKKLEVLNVTGCYKLETLYLAKGLNVYLSQNTSINIIYND